jgi:hypothetical protein
MRRVNHIRLLAMALLGGMVMAACATDPQPFPLPLNPPDTKAIFTSTEQKQPTVTVGLPGAVSDPKGGEEIVLAVTPHTQQQRGPVFSDGSFAVRLQALQSADRVEAWVERGEQSSSHVTVPVREAAQDISGPTVDSVSAVQSGLSVVRGHYDAGRQVMVANPHNGAAAMVVVDAQGVFAVSIAAAPGDSLAVFGRDPGQGVTTASTEVSVPGA